MSFEFINGKWELVPPGSSRHLQSTPRSESRNTEAEEESPFSPLTPMSYRSTETPPFTPRAEQLGLSPLRPDEIEEVDADTSGVKDARGYRDNDALIKRPNEWNIAGASVGVPGNMAPSTNPGGSIQEQHVKNIFINVGEGANVDMRSQETHHHHHGPEKKKNGSTEKDEGSQPQQPEDVKDEEHDRHWSINMLTGLGDALKLAASMASCLLPSHRLLGSLLGFTALFMLCLNGIVAFVPGGQSAVHYLNSMALDHLVWVSTTPISPPTPDASTLPLSFKHPIPTQESDIMPEAVELNWQGVMAVDPTLATALEGDYENARKKATSFKNLNKGFVAEMQALSIQQYRALHSLIEDIARTRDGDDGTWFWFWGKSKAQAAKRHHAQLKAILLDTKLSRTRERHLIVQTLDEVARAGGQEGPVPAGICHIERALQLQGEKSDVEELLDQQAASRVMCSSERQSGVRWRDVEEAIDRFLLTVNHVEQSLEKNWSGTLSTREQDEAVALWAQDVIDALIELAKLSK